MAFVVAGYRATTALLAKELIPIYQLAFGLSRFTQ